MPDEIDPVTPPADPPAPKMLTQDEVNTLLAKERRKHEDKYADYADLKKAAEDLATLKAAQLTDAQRVEAERDAAKAATAAAEARAEAAEQATKNALIRSAIVAEASRQGAIDPSVVVALIDPSAVTIGDDGQVTGADKAVEAELAARTFLVGTATPPAPKKPQPDPGQGARSPAGSTTDAGRDLYRERHANKRTPAPTP